MKKTATLFMTALLIFTAISGSACGKIGPNASVESVDETKTQLYVSNLNAGFGYDWLMKLKERFERDYAETSFEDRKKGVQVIIDTENTVNGRWLILPTDTWEVYFTENLPYNEFVAQKYLLDISDVVKAEAYGEEKTIESKMDEEVKSGLTAYNGNYYAIPHYEAYRGISYNVTVFDENKLYFADEKDNGNAGFIIRNGDKKSAGPNGVYGDYDDGLPSTIEEFLSLCDRMVLMGVTPIVWPGAAVGYTQYICDIIAANISGYETAKLDYTFDSGDETARIVTGFDDGGKAIVEEKTISDENGYLLKQTEGKYTGMYVLEQLVRNIDKYVYPLSNSNSTFTQLDAQEEFIYGQLENKPIGMLVDGNYWWNEADEAYKRAVNQYGSRAESLEFAWMPMPHKITESSVAEDEEQTLIDCLKSYCFVNANIADDPVKTQVAKLFVSYAYTDESLQEFTTETGVAKGLNYLLTDEQYDSLNYFGKSCWTLRSNAKIVRQLSSDRMFIENEEALSYNVYASVVNGQAYLEPFTGFRAGISAADYFKGTWMSAESWNESYSKYF